MVSLSTCYHDLYLCLSDALVYPALMFHVPTPRPLLRIEVTRATEWGGGSRWWRTLPGDLGSMGIQDSKILACGPVYSCFTYKNKIKDSIWSVSRQQHQSISLWCRPFPTWSSLCRCVGLTHVTGCMGSRREMCGLRSTTDYWEVVMPLPSPVGRGPTLSFPLSFAIISSLGLHFNLLYFI